MHVCRSMRYPSTYQRSSICRHINDRRYVAAGGGGERRLKAPSRVELILVLAELIVWCTGIYHGARVPVTAKLSRRFYEKFGDEIANELVEWFNAVDATYRSDLRALNELNFDRFDAKLEQRVVELETKLSQRFVTLEAKLSERFVALEAKLSERFVTLEAKVGQRFVALETKLDQRIAELRAETQVGLERLETRLTKRLFAFWVAQAATTAALVFGVVKLVH